MLSIAPLLVIAVWIAGLVLGEKAVRGELGLQIAALVGDEGAKALEGMIQASANRSSEGLIASAWGILMLMFGASRVVNELRDSLNAIWDARVDGSFRGYLLSTTSAFALVLAAGFLLLMSLVISAILAGVTEFLSGTVGELPYLMELWNLISSIAAGTFLFAWIMRGLPAVTLSWRDVIPGALLTSVLFTLGKSAIGFYLGRASVTSTYGAAGSLAVFLLWVYYASQIFYIGVIVTKVMVRGKSPVHTGHSVPT